MGMKASGVLAKISLALATAPPIPKPAGVSTTVAPRNPSSLRRSLDIDSGMVRISL